MSNTTAYLDAARPLTPELRDRLLARLDGVDDGVQFPLLTAGALRRLAAIESPDAPVLSVYVDLSPERRADGSWRIHFKNRARACLESLRDAPQRRAAAADLDRIEATLRDGLPALGRGAAFFVCERIGLWREVALPLALPDRVVAAPRPYLRPLVRTRDEHDRFLIACLGLGESRFHISQIGVVDEVLRIPGTRLRGLLTDWAGRDAREDVAEKLEQEAGKLLAGVAALAFARAEARYLLLAAPPKLENAFVSHLPPAVRERVAGRLSLAVEASPVEVAAAAEPVQREVEAREEVATIRGVDERRPDRAVWGLEPTLEALNARRVMTLVVDDAFRAPGGQCEGCAVLLARGGSSCPACAGTVAVVEDLAEAALEAALAQQASLEIVRSAEGRALLAERGPLGAALRY